MWTDEVSTSAYNLGKQVIAIAESNRCLRAIEAGALSPLPSVPTTQNPKKRWHGSASRGKEASKLLLWRRTNLYFRISPANCAAAFCFHGLGRERTFRPDACRVSEIFT